MVVLLLFWRLTTFGAGGGDEASERCASVTPAILCRVSMSYGRIDMGRIGCSNRVWSGEDGALIHMKRSDAGEGLRYIGTIEG